MIIINDIVLYRMCYWYVYSSIFKHIAYNILDYSPIIYIYRYPR